MFRRDPWNWSIINKALHVPHTNELAARCNPIYYACVGTNLVDWELWQRGRCVATALAEVHVARGETVLHGGGKYMHGVWTTGNTRETEEIKMNSWCFFGVFHNSLVHDYISLLCLIYMYLFCDILYLLKWLRRNLRKEKKKQ